MSGRGSRGVRPVPTPLQLEPSPSLITVTTETWQMNIDPSALFLLYIVPPPVFTRASSFPSPLLTTSLPLILAVTDLPSRSPVPPRARLSKHCHLRHLPSASASIVHYRTQHSTSSRPSSVRSRITSWRSHRPALRSKT